MVSPGGDRLRDITHNLQVADVILLLISPNFVASDEHFNIELQKALARQREGQACAIPILIRPVNISLLPFTDLQCLPRNVKPVSTWDNQDEAWLEISHGIQQILTSPDVAAHAPGAQSKPYLQSNALPWLAIPLFAVFAVFVHLALLRIASIPSVPQPVVNMNHTPDLAVGAIVQPSVPDLWSNNSGTEIPISKKQPSPAESPHTDPIPLRLTAFLDKKQYRDNELVSIEIKTNQSAYVYVLADDRSQWSQLLYPDEFSGTNRVSPGVPLKIPDGLQRAAGVLFHAHALRSAQAPPGTGDRLLVVATREPIDRSELQKLVTRRSSRENLRMALVHLRYEVIR